MSVVAFLDLRLRPDSAAEALGVLDEVLVATRAFEGCLGVEVLVQADDPARVIVVERWASMEADTAYRAWREADGPSALTPYVAGIAVTHFAPHA